MGTRVKKLPGSGAPEMQKLSHAVDRHRFASRIRARYCCCSSSVRARVDPVCDLGFCRKPKNVISARPCRHHSSNLATCFGQVCSSLDVREGGVHCDYHILAHIHDVSSSSLHRPHDSQTLELPCLDVKAHAGRFQGTS